MVGAFHCEYLAAGSVQVSSYQSLLTITPSLISFSPLETIHFLGDVNCMASNHVFFHLKTFWTRANADDICPEDEP